MTTDLDEELGYDADHDDESQYCQHGTWIGSWWGPDYLCHWCEEGISRAEMIEAQRAQAARRRADQIDKLTKVCDAIAAMDRPYSSMPATWLYEFVAGEIDRHHLEVA